MSSYACKDCQHYLQHYILDEQHCAAINCGHCKFPRSKPRPPLTPACQHFQLKEPPSAPANLYFLTEGLIRHLMTLVPQPEIVDSLTPEQETHEEDVFYPPKQK